MDERAYANRGQAASAQTPATLNARFNTSVTALNSLCSEAESFLDRISPRPPQGPSQTPERLQKLSEGAPPMTMVADNMEGALQRLRSIINELHQIA